MTMKAEVSPPGHRLRSYMMYAKAPHCHYQGLLSSQAQRKLCEHCRVNSLSICGAFAIDHAEELAGVTQQVEHGLVM